MKVLIVEDNVDHKESLELVLKAEGYTCYGTPSVEGAKLIADVHPPDCVILDWVMKDGGEPFLAWLRSREATLHTPVVVVSGLPAGELDPLKYLPNTVVVQKPYEVRELLAIMAAMNVIPLHKRITANAAGKRGRDTP